MLGSGYKILRYFHTFSLQVQDYVHTNLVSIKPRSGSEKSRTASTPTLYSIKADPVRGGSWTLYSLFTKPYRVLGIREIAANEPNTVSFMHNLFFFLHPKYNSEYPIYFNIF
jgi:hypothetical protein